MRVDTHNHFLPGVDDGCRNLPESFECLRMMVGAGYTRSFCTPHFGSTEFNDLTTADIAARVEEFRKAIALENIPLEIRGGCELRLTADMPEYLTEAGIPTYGLNTKYVLADCWEVDWPLWATRGVEWLQKQGLMVILAHPERMPMLRKQPGALAELKALGVLFQGNLNPLSGVDAPDTGARAEQYLREGLYFMLGSDAHRPETLATRIQGLARAGELVGAAAVEQLTVVNPGKLWV